MAKSLTGLISSTGAISLKTNPAVPGSRRSAREAGVDLVDLLQMPPDLGTVSPREAEESSSD